MFNETFKMQPDDAIRWFAKKNLIPSWDWRDVWEQQHARAFTVAKSASFDVLADIQRATQQAIENGLTKEQFRASLEQTLRNKGWWGRKKVINPQGKIQTVQLGSAWRLDTIYRTNTQSAFMSGRWHQLGVNKANRPYLQYVAVMDGVTRPSHAALHNKIYHIDDPIWATIYPPNGFNCRCRVRALTEKQAKQKGITKNFKLPDDFPDEGFSSNVANNSMALDAKLYKSATALEPNNLAKISERLVNHLNDPIIKTQFINNVDRIAQRTKSADIITAGFLSPNIVKRLGVAHGALLLAGAIIIANHGDVDKTDWQSLTQTTQKPKIKALELSTGYVHYILINEGRQMQLIIRNSKQNPVVVSLKYIEDLSIYDSSDFTRL